MRKSLLVLITTMAFTACTLQIGMEGAPQAAIPTESDQVDAALTRPASVGIQPRATLIPATFTPTPTPFVGTPPPTLPPPPTETPTLTPVPTVIPPTPDVISGSLPDGWIAYRKTVQIIPNDPSPSAYGCQVWVQRTDGSEARDLTPEGANCATMPALSPDGQWVAFLVGYIRHLSAGLGGTLWVTRIDGSEAVQLRGAPNTPTMIVWSWDGRRIANYYYGDFKWHVYDVAGGGTAIGAVDALEPDLWRVPNLSPDGRYRATACEELRRGYRQMCITELASDPRPLGQLHLDAGIVWTPDGQWIVYQDKDGTYAVHPDGSGRERITEMAGDWFFDAAD